MVLWNLESLSESDNCNACTGKHVYDVGMMGNGALAGLVAITSGTSTIEPWGSIIVGLVAGALYCLGSQCSIWMKVRGATQLLKLHLSLTPCRPCACTNET